MVGLFPKDYISLWNLLSKTRKRQYLYILFLMLAAAIAELISLGSIVPFLGVMISRESLFNSNRLSGLWKLLDYQNSNQILLPITLFFILGALFAASLRVYLLYYSTKLSNATGSDISVKIYENTLYLPYIEHVSRNSADVITGITGKANGVVSSVILPILNILSSLCILIFMMIGFLLINATVTFQSFAVLGILYFLIAIFSKKKINENSLIVSNSQSKIQKALQEGLGAIRDVILDKSQIHYIEIYKNSDIPYRKAVGNSLFIASSPRYILEGLGIAFIAIISYQLVKSTDNILGIIPVIGSIAMGAQRVLPLIQLLYVGWVSLKSGSAMLADILGLLSRSCDKPYFFENENLLEEMDFRKSLTLKGLSFKYNPETSYLFKGINLEIKKGARIGFIGKTGSGKSTLIDIILGLLTPTEGEIFIDKQKLEMYNLRLWQNKIAHVPQFIYLSDSSLLENIAFGIKAENIDLERVKHSAERAQLSDYIKSLKHGYETLVGERGIRLSGGQRQRIGIARALYKKASVIVFDEATSSLDNETEKMIIESIENLDHNLTIIMIAHRLSTLENCDQIYELKNKKLTKVNKRIK